MKALASLLRPCLQDDKRSTEILFISAFCAKSRPSKRGCNDDSTAVLAIVGQAFSVARCTGAVLKLAHQLVPHNLGGTGNLAGQVGSTGVAAMLRRAHSQGNGTYAALEAVSNNVNILAEPRVHTGKMTLLYMALSLAFTASGIILP